MGDAQEGTKCVHYDTPYVPEYARVCDSGSDDALAAVIGEVAAS
jgi:hypothetical protein